MANITEEHLHHLARRHHATMRKLDGMREQITGISHHAFSLAETGAGAWLGGAIEGKYDGYALGPLPINLLAGIGFLVAGYAKLGGATYSQHFENFGNGLVSSWAAAIGYAFGKRWRETGKAFGGGGHPWAQPYAEGGWSGGPPPGPGPAMPPPPPPPDAQASGAISNAEMAAIVARMQQAANAPAR
jgi:hypothetical protein